MRPHELLSVALEPPRILAAQGLTPDPWQRDVLFSAARYVLLNCSRGAGKSRVTSALALHTALFQPGSLVLLVSRSQRQSVELLRYVKQGLRALGGPVPVVKNNETQLEFLGGSRIIALPGQEATIRTFQGVRLLILDEAARIPDELYASVSPMTGIARGRTICLSTPFGPRGFFWKEWHREESPWERFRIPWQQCPRLTPEFIEEERRKFGDAWISQEYECNFASLTGLVYPDFEQCLHRGEAAAGGAGKKVGGMDFGFRHPFVALEAVLHDDVLWVNREIYVRETPLHEISRLLPRSYLWYADPSGRTEIEELRAAGHKVLSAYNDIRVGLQAVTARIRTGRLKVNALHCPNLVNEARLYRYPEAGERAMVGEQPVDNFNHALDALRYLVVMIDRHFVARLRPQDSSVKDDSADTAAASRKRSGPRLDDPTIWNKLS